MNEHDNSDKNHKILIKSTFFKITTNTYVKKCDKKDQKSLIMMMKIQILSLFTLVITPTQI